MEGKSLLDAMRDGKLEGMQDFDSVIKELIEKDTIALEDGLAFATNQNNLILSLKGLTSSDDFIRSQADDVVPRPATNASHSFSLSRIISDLLPTKKYYAGYLSKLRGTLTSRREQVAVAFH
jgi:hypothetical protein